MTNLEERLKIIECRNARVEFDKAWETRWIRRGLIASITYLCAVILLNVLRHEGAWKHAFVPVMGYLLSTLTLPRIKEKWLEQKRKQEKQKATKSDSA